MAKKILIIDDEVDVMKMVVYRLKARGYEVFTSTTGEKGLDIAQTQKPDLIMLDYRLPDMRAPEISDKLKRDDALKQIPVILITASIDGIENKAKECNAICYIAKPIEPEELYEKVEKWIK